MCFGAPEYFAVAVFGLTVVASLSSGHLVKGLISALAGLFLATIGLDPVTGDMRNTFDNPNPLQRTVSGSRACRLIRRLSSARNR